MGTNRKRTLVFPLFSSFTPLGVHSRLNHCAWLKVWLVILWWLGVCGLNAQSPAMPTKPTRYVSDRAFVLDEAQIEQLNTRLETFERETSNQVVVAIFASLPPGAEMAQYSTQVFRAWQVGQADKDNGVVLFVYKNDRKLFISTGRGLEGVLPDMTCRQIIENEIVPRFKAGDFPGGIQAGVESIIAATQGEYQGTGKTVGERKSSGSVEGNSFSIMRVLIMLVVIIHLIRRFSRGRDTLMNRGGYSSLGGGWLGGGGSSGSSWSSGDRGSSGGFSGGGGSSGGGGAGGSW